MAPKKKTKASSTNRTKTSSRRPPRTSKAKRTTSAGKSRKAGSASGAGVQKAASSRSAPPKPSAARPTTATDPMQAPKGPPPAPAGMKGGPAAGSQRGRMPPGSRPTSRPQGRPETFSPLTKNWKLVVMFMLFDAAYTVWEFVMFVILFYKRKDTLPDAWTEEPNFVDVVDSSQEHFPQSRMVPVMAYHGVIAALLVALDAWAAWAIANSWNPPHVPFVTSLSGDAFVRFNCLILYIVFLTQVMLNYPWFGKMLPGFSLSIYLVVTLVFMINICRDYMKFANFTRRKMYGLGTPEKKPITASRRAASEPKSKANYPKW